MSAKWNKWDWDYVWHFVGGAAVIFIIGVIPLSLISVLPSSSLVLSLLVLCVSIFGIVREFGQHNWGALTAHQWLEGVLWGIGALSAALIALSFQL